MTAKAHNGPIDIQGITIASVDDKVRLQAVETWFDPLEMFRQIAPDGKVEKIAKDGEGADDSKVVVDPEEVAKTHAEMGTITGGECPFMNKE